MRGLLYRKFALPALFALDAETAHGLSLAALRLGLAGAGRVSDDPCLATRAAGLSFANPLGIAAGYDKNAEVPDAILRLGFGFAEVGTVTPRPQPGNPRPRIFRLPEDRAIINRLGFNNEGHAAALDRLRNRSSRAAGIVGVNVGANKDSEDRIADYEAGISTFYEVADYFTVNISSPNTPGLRDLQTRENLAALLLAVTKSRDEKMAGGAARKPILLKIAPDLTEADLDDIAAELLAHRLDGAIVSNTTLSRSGLTNSPVAKETGGLSGPPLFERSTAVLARLRQRIGSEPALVGVGGVDSAETALAKIRAGADLIQLYTGLVYGGPGLPGEICRGLAALTRREQVTSIRDLRDTTVSEWAARPIF
jgi:dihydroorotate dehydrogenase